MRYLRFALFGLTALGGWAAWPGGSARADDLSIASGDNWFCDASYQFGVCETTVQVGDSVTWTYPLGITAHTTTECGSSCDSPTAAPLWDSGFMFPGGAFTYEFGTAGTFDYFCTLHPHDMRGKVIVVEPAATPTPEPAVAPAQGDGEADATPAAVLSRTGSGPGATATTVSALPASGGAPQVGERSETAIAAGAALAAAGLAAWIAAPLATRRRRH